ncbi:MAG TPA: hypothetical protein VGQ55_04205 [Pyrinomonadaceae bacterium]|nr:hypothetical protein [Pyrinomonadaceae bacterium]
MGKSESKTPPKPSTTASSGSSTSAASKECHPKCTIESKTAAKSPADRKRTKIGVGEEVTITAKGNAAEWTKSGGGRLNPKSGVNTSVTLTASDKAETITITAKHSGCGCSNSITFSVVEPSNWTLKRKKGTKLRHKKGHVDCGWLGEFYVHPDDVNFYNVEFREKDSKYVGTGSYKGYNGDYHGNYPPPVRASEWIPLSSHTETDGSKGSGYDTIYTGDPGPTKTGSKPPFNVGSGYFPITLQWQLPSVGKAHDFPEVRQEDEIFSTGKCESRKGGNTESTMWDDKTSTH